MIPPLLLLLSVFNGPSDGEKAVVELDLATVTRAFAAADQDGSGSIELAEARGAGFSRYTFRGLDVDGSGGLQRDEFVVGSRMRAASEREHVARDLEAEVTRILAARRARAAEIRRGEGRPEKGSGKGPEKSSQERPQEAAQQGKSGSESGSDDLRRSRTQKGEAATGGPGEVRLGARRKARQEARSKSGRVGDATPVPAPDPSPTARGADVPPPPPEGPVKRERLEKGEKKAGKSDAQTSTPKAGGGNTVDGGKGKRAAGRGSAGGESA